MSLENLTKVRNLLVVENPPELTVEQVEILLVVSCKSQDRLERLEALWSLINVTVGKNIDELFMQPKVFEMLTLVHEQAKTVNDMQIIDLLLQIFVNLDHSGKIIQKELYDQFSARDVLFDLSQRNNLPLFMIRSVLAFCWCVSEFHIDNQKEEKSDLPDSVVL